MAFIYDLADTWNDAGTTFTAIKMDVTDTASNAASLLMDLQVGGTSKFKVAKDGSFTVNTNNISNAIYVDNAGRIVNFSNTLSIATSGATPRLVGLGGSAAFSLLRVGGLDLILARDAAGTLAQRNSTNAQTFNLYNTYTDSSNYERGYFKWTSNIFEIGADAAGTGNTNRIVQLRAGTQIAFKASLGLFEFVNKDIVMTNSFFTFPEQTAPSTPSANNCRVYAKDNGSGKTQLVVLMPDGIETVLATET